MLWRPVTPVYPSLIKQDPEGLTLEEATQMRKKGRSLVPICKLGKNGVYCDLVKNVRETFEACELVQINCQGLNASDYKKIGAKLKDLVPCVLISFENEHILMWREKDWKSSLTELKNDAATFVGALVEGKAKLLAADTATFVGQVIEGEVELLPPSTSAMMNSIAMKASIEDISTQTDSLTIKDVASW